MALTTLGTCSYNGYVFGPTTETVSVDARPVPDRAGRSVAHVVYTIVLRETVTGSPTDTAVLDARRQLTAYGQAFTYLNKGLGDLSINVGAATDVLWGPKPEVLRLKPVGRDRATEITWSVTVAVPECADASFAGRIMEFNYRLSADIDRSGYSRRVYRGYIRIPLTRDGGGRAVGDSADLYRELIVPNKPVGFRREAQSYDIDEAKTTLEFTITDLEMPPTAPPPGVIEAKASHTIQSENRGFLTWKGAIEATYETARDAGKEDAWNAFFRLVGARLREAQRNIKQPIGGDQKPIILPFALTLREPEIYGRVTAQFSFVYTFVTSRESILKASALWSPVPGSSWHAWEASLNNTAFHPRGNAKLVFRPGDDELIDLCRPDARVLRAGAPPGGVPGTNTLTNRPPSRVDQFDAPGGRNFVRDLNLQMPTPQSSWLKYEATVYFEFDDGTVCLKPLPRGPLVHRPPDRRRLAARIDNNIAAPVAGVMPDRIVQHRVAPCVNVYLIGSAVRAGFPVPIPQVVRIANQEPIPANRPDRGEGFSQGIVANLGVPLFSASWKLRFILKRHPGAAATPMPMPPNPMLVAERPV